MGKALESTSGRVPWEYRNATLENVMKRMKISLCTVPVRSMKHTICCTTKVLLAFSYDATRVSLKVSDKIGGKNNSFS